MLSEIALDMVSAKEVLGQLSRGDGSSMRHLEKMIENDAFPPDELRAAFRQYCVIHAASCSQRMQDPALGIGQRAQMQHEIDRAVETIGKIDEGQERIMYLGIPF